MTVGVASCSVMGHVGSIVDLVLRFVRPVPNER